MSLTDSKNLFLKNNLICLKDGTYNSGNITVVVTEGKIKCVGINNTLIVKVLVYEFAHPIPIFTIVLQ